MNWSDKLPFYEVLKAKGKLKPEDVMPESNDGEGMLMDIFNELSTSRQIGMGVGYIPITTLWEAKDRYKLTDAAISMLRALDNEFVKRNNAKHA
jgi:hypothetical protein